MRKFTISDRNVINIYVLYVLYALFLIEDISCNVQKSYSLVHVKSVYTKTFFFLNNGTCTGNPEIWMQFKAYIERNTKHTVRIIKNVMLLETLIYCNN
jgi:hypothetical protein